MKRWMAIVTVAAVAPAAGCTSLGAPRPATYERMLLPLMSDVEKAEYYRRPTWAERKAYLYEINLIQRYESAPPAIRKAIRNEEVIPGMTQEQVIMSWGVPAERVPVKPNPNPEIARLEGQKEYWLYKRVWMPDLTYRYEHQVQFTNGVVLQVEGERRRRASGP